jgi:leucyl aminopeptidase
MPSDKALHPGDIVRAANGKTIEVLNTDAEGRLTLADAFSYAIKYEKPDAIIDLATLTGACRVALGEDIAGLWGNDDNLMDKILQASKETGEMVWRMPLPESYKKLIKSHIADLRNISTGRYGGAITAAIFLSEFVDNIPWAHLDIAGPAYAEKATPLTPVGGAGYGVQLMLKFLKEYIS